MVGGGKAVVTTQADYSVREPLYPSCIIIAVIILCWPNATGIWDLLTSQSNGSVLRYL